MCADVNACACMPMSVHVRVSACMRVSLFDMYLRMVVFAHAVAGESVLSRCHYKDSA